MAVGQLTLRIRLFGGGQVCTAGDIHSFAADKRHQLLAFLASQEDWVSRDRLAALFWSDMPTQSAKQNLRRLLGRTRELPWLDTLEIDRTRLRWQVDTDVKDFRTALQRRDWQIISACYQGPFLDGLESYDNSEFAHWLLLERERFHNLWRDELFHKVDELCAQKAYSNAMVLLRLALEQDRFDEDALASYLDLALQTGDIKVARSLYQAFARRLTHELGIEPSSATQQLALRLDEGQRATLPQQSAVVFLPAATTSFIGRDLELAEINNLLAKPLCRLLTLLGPGGVGKTRLAVQAAKELADKYSDGVVFVAFESLKHPQEIPGTIIEALEASPEGQDDPLDQLIQHIGDKQLLLILDNFEQLLEGVTILSQLLAHCPGLQLMVTSRERLKLEHEWLLAITGLAYPGRDVSPEDALAYDAVALFVERAQRVRPTFILNRAELPAVIDICHFVEGFPLAIELAAAWIRAMSSQDIAQELQQNLDILTSSSNDTQSRQSSIRSAFEYSWALLTAQEQVVLRRLVVFRSGFTKEAASAVAGANIVLLAALLDKSLLRLAQNRRYEIHPLLQQFTHEKLLADDDMQSVYRRHANYFMALAERAEPLLQGAQQTEWLATLDSDYQNIIAALDWLQVHSQKTAAARLASSLGNYWRIRGQYRVGRAYLESTYSYPETQQHPDIQAKVLGQLGLLTWNAADYPAAQQYLKESLNLYSVVGDNQGITRALNNLGIVAHEQGDYEGAQDYYQQALERVRYENDDTKAASILQCLGSLALEQGDLTKAQVNYESALQFNRNHANQLGIASALVGLGSTALRQAKYLAAQRYYEECLVIARNLGDVGRVGFALRGLGQITLAQGTFTDAERYFNESLELSRSIGDRRASGYALQGLGLTALEQDQLGEAQAYLEEGLALQKTLGDQAGIASAQIALGRLALKHQDNALARRLLLEALALANKLQSLLGTVYVLEGLAEAATLSGSYEDAVQLWGITACLRDQLGMIPSPLEAQRREASLHHSRNHLTESVAQQAWDRGRTAHLETFIKQFLSADSLGTNDR